MSQAKGDARVTVTANGPYVVSGNVPLHKQTIGVDAEGGSEKWIEGKAYPAEADYALCRCGHSKNKPFCDGSHVAIKFRGIWMAYGPAGCGVPDTGNSTWRRRLRRSPAGLAA